MGEVVYLDNITSIDLPPDRILEKAMGELQSVVLAGFTKDGDEYFLSSVAGGPQALWLVERLKKRLLDAVDELAET